MSQSVMLLPLVFLVGTFHCSKGFLFRWELGFNGEELQIQYGGYWGYICADGFGQVEGDVVCKILDNNEGSSNKLQAVEVYPVFNAQLTGHLWQFLLEGVKCNGSEDRIPECQHNGFFNASCPSSNNVVVKCRRPDEDSFNNVAVPETYVGVYFCYYDGNIRRKKILHCDSGTQIQATRRFLSENNIPFSEHHCGREDSGVEQCNPRGVCNTNDSIICIYDGNEARFPRLLRLVEGNSSQEGRLEVSLGNGIWASVCSRQWGHGAARLACGNLGFAGMQEYGAVEGNASYPMLRYLRCFDKHEIYWYDCIFRLAWSKEDYACSSFAFVKCSDFANEGTLRLTETLVSAEGRLQVFHQGVWGGVRHRNFLNVVCNHLGFRGGDYSSSFIGFDSYPSVPVVLDLIVCNGSEVSVFDCEYQWYNETYPDKYVGGADVRCNRPGIVEYRPRLFNGTTVYEGRLEVWEDMQWRRVCKSTIGPVEAEAICKLLGHHSLEMFYNWPKFGNGIGPVTSFKRVCDPLDTSARCGHLRLFIRKLDCDSVAVRCTKWEEDSTKPEETEEEHPSTILRVLLAVASFLLALAIMSGMVICVIKGRRMRSNEPTADNHGHGMPPAYTSVSTPETNNVEQNLDPPE